MEVDSGYILGGIIVLSVVTLQGPPQTAETVFAGAKVNHTSGVLSPTPSTIEKNRCASSAPVSAATSVPELNSLA